MLHSDFRILEAENGEQCVAMLEQYGTGIALILLDIVMPGMNGFEVLEYMTRNHWIEEVPVIMVSSENSEPYIRKAYELGVSDVCFSYAEPFSFTISLRYVIIFCCDTLILSLRMKRNYKWKRKRSFRCRIRTSSSLV